MKNVFLALALTLTTGAFAQDNLVLDGSIRQLAPDGYIVLETIYGDLNKDSQEDVVLVIKGTDPKKIIIDEIRGELDLNQRGLIIALKNKQKYEVIVENLSCFYSEDEYGGVYFKPDILTSIEKGNLHILFAHGRYGHWRYNFRYQAQILS
ncbi:hypothetical protein Vca1114GL_00093 [Vibrio campbellii]|uniref:hypothetical protein n=1 Tax=Vibrio campbellii TaxID=680 RepID=UPI00097FA8A2|nr:hypothetical protein [Vibrio campbellii]AQM66616.1 hypothetical protein Vca1114GL_00093 [Vibrio campbellii]